MSASRTSRGWLRAYFAALLVAVTLAWATPATRAADNTCEGHADAPAGISLRLSLNNGQTTFREGEIIALTAEYSASGEKKYTVNNRNYDRSGRLDGMEVFCIDPDAATDPLASYFNSAGGFGGGLFSSIDPGRKPFAVDLELNEWRSLPPGSYSLNIVGNRASEYSKDEPLNLGDKTVLLRSNSVQFQVVPADPGWQAAQLAAAVSTLDSSSSSNDEKKHAARVLRFLGSEASTRELARRYWYGERAYGWEMKFGLYGSPHRQVAIDAMKAELGDPAHPVTGEFVDTLVRLEMESEPRFKLPAWDERNPEPFRRAMAANTAEHDRRAAEYMSTAAAAIEAKTGEARAVSISELLEPRGRISPAVRQQWRQMLVASFDALPVSKQNELMESRWPEIAGPEWLPQLEKIVAGPASPGRQFDRPDRSVALLHIYELSPEQGRSLILKEIASPRGGIGVDILGLLPEQESQQIGATALARLQQHGSSDDIDFALIDRYATARQLPDIKAIYESHRGDWACAPQSSMLRYFLRTDPAYGAHEVAAALAARAHTGCYRQTLSQLSSRVRVSQAQAVAIATLDDLSPEVARDAAIALQNYGSPEAEAALWKRLEKLHNKWKDNPFGLHPHRGAIVMAEDSGVEDALVSALLAGQGWFADQSSIRRLKDLSSEEMHPRLDMALSVLDEKQFQLSLRWWPQNDVFFDLGWYQGTGMAAFEEKLAQFPAGSHFRIVTTQAEQEARAADFARVQQAMVANGLQLEIESPR